MGQINTNNYPTVDSLTDTDLLIVENATHGTGTTTPKQLRENAIGTDPLQTTAQTVTGAINELKNSGSLPENPLSIAHGGTGNSNGYIRTGQATGTTVGTGSTIEGHNNTGAGTYCHAEGTSTTASNDSAHSEGEHTLASSTASHAEGSHSTASGVGAHSEGSAYIDFDSGNYVGNTASGEGAHAEGMGTTASGTASHTEGYGTSASGNYSHASGGSTTAGYAYQTVVGKINDNKSSTLFEVGNGTGANARSNAFEVYSDGKISCDNGSSKFQFTQSSGVDGYNDASGTFHAFGSGGASTLSDLTDTSISSPTNGQVLGYNSTSSKWENQNASGGGNTVSKTRYQISSSSWSSSANSDGYYSKTISLSPSIKSSPNVYIAGSSSTAQPTATQKRMYAMVERCALSASGATLTLYAKTKPTSSFYIWVEGEEGTASANLVGNIVSPNERITISTSDECIVGTYDGKPLFCRAYTGTVTENTSTGKGILQLTIDTNISSYLVDVSPVVVQLRSTARRAYVGQYAVAEGAFYSGEINASEIGKTAQVIFWYTKS